MTQICTFCALKVEIAVKRGVNEPSSLVETNWSTNRAQWQKCSVRKAQYFAISKVSCNITMKKKKTCASSRRTLRASNQYIEFKT